METAPQAVTERYVSNLLHHGRNKEFDILNIERGESIVDGNVVGYFFKTYVIKQTADEGAGRSAVGATPSQALRRALEKHGVTFR